MNELRRDNNVSLCSAIGFSRYGPPEVLSLVAIPRRVPGPREVAIRVHGTPVNPADTLFREGGVERLITGVDHPYIPGLEASGTVVGLGQEVDHLAQDDAVIGIGSFIPTGRGLQAEYIVLPVGSVARLPHGCADDLSWSTLPMNGLTALLALDVAESAPAFNGDCAVLIVGVNGVVGGLVAQLARLRDIPVIGVHRPGNSIPWWPTSGEDPGLILLEAEDSKSLIRQTAPIGRPIGAVVDTANLGGEIASLLVSGGDYISLRPVHIDDSSNIRHTLISVRQYQTDPDRLDLLVDLVLAGSLALPPVRVLPPADVRQAHQSIDEGGIRERWVLDWR